MLIRTISLAVAVAAGASIAEARDTTHYFPINAAMNTAAAKEKLDPAIKFYFGENSPKTGSKGGSYVANRKTNAFNKSDQEACEWVFLSSLLALQERAKSQGANAVVNIHSFYKKNAYHSDDKYECHAGAIMTGVALKGTVATLK